MARVDAHGCGDDLDFTATVSSFRDYVGQFELADDNRTYFTTDSLNKISTELPTLSIFHLNIRSLNKHATELVSLLSSMKLSFDVICLIEVHNTNLTAFFIPLEWLQLSPNPLSTR